MGTYGTEFVNVADDPTLPPVERVGLEPVELWGRRIRAAVARVRETGGYVYLPPRSAPYLLGSAPSVPVDGALNTETSLYIPPLVRLVFAPGARMGVQAGTTVEIAGELDAPAAMIFEIRGEHIATRSARVILTSDSIQSVLPEWWGAQRVTDVLSSAADSALAIQAALDAGHRDRDIRPSRPGLRREIRGAIPVLLSGAYKIGQTLHVGIGADGRTGSRAPVILRALATRQARFAYPSLSASDDFVGETMLAIRGIEGLHLVDVSFDARANVNECVTLLAIGASAGGSFDRCRFARAREACVRVGPRVFERTRSALDAVNRGEQNRPAYRAVVDGAASVGGEDTSCPQFVGCAFEGLEPREPIRLPERPPRRERLLTLRTSGAPPTMLQDCSFVGHASEAIVVQ